MKTHKKKVLIISPNFSGGGLETRINTIVENFTNQYTFSLLTKTRLSDMRISPTLFFDKIYRWEEQYFAIKSADILSLHPYNIFSEIQDLTLFNKKNIIYTLHGESSFLEDFNSFGKYVDVFYSVSEKLIETFKVLYPKYASKIYLYRNYYPNSIKENIFNFNSCKDILFSITNTNNWDYLNDFIKLIPETYTIHIIGHIPQQKYKHPKVIYEGFVDIESFLKNKQFCFSFARGGFAAMELIAKGIPIFLIYDRHSSTYTELVTRENFENLSAQNFVTHKLFNSEEFFKNIQKILDNRKDYILIDLLKKYNDRSLMFNPYECFEGELYAKY